MSDDQKKPADPKAKAKPRKTAATRKKAEEAKREASDAAAEGKREVAKAVHREFKDEEDGGAGLPSVKGPDLERSMDEEDGALYMSMEDLYHLLHLQSEFLSSEKSIEICRKDMANAELAYLRKQLEVGKRTTTAQVENVKARAKLQRLHQALERSYKIKMSRITFDDETGLIRSRDDG